MWKLEFVFRALNHYYFMIHTFSFVIQQSLFDLQPCWILMNWKFRGGLDNVAEKSRAVELNMILNEGFICVNPLFQEFICINPSFGCNHSISLFCLFRQSMNCPQCIYSCIWQYLRLVVIILFHSTAYSDQVWTAHCPLPTMYLFLYLVVCKIPSSSQVLHRQQSKSSLLLLGNSMGQSVYPWCIPQSLLVLILLHINFVEQAHHYLITI